MKNCLLTVEYDGTNFSGWQRQPGRRTVQGELERVLSALCKKEITLQGTSRTDAGVHAYGQRAAFHGEFGIPIDRIPKAANHLLAGGGPFVVGDVRIREAVEVAPEFHPRLDAKGKKYIYKIRSAPQPDIMQRNYSYQVERPLDLVAMEKAAAFLVGEQDFHCFLAAGGKEPKSTVRTIYSVKWKREPLSTDRRKPLSTDLRKPLSTDRRESAHGQDSLGTGNLTFEIIGNGFLYNMVRIIVGTLAEVGMAKRDPDEIKDIIQGRDRTHAGHTAPPGGLYLAEVYFNEEELKR